MNVQKTPNTVLFNYLKQFKNYLSQINIVSESIKSWRPLRQMLATEAINNSLLMKTSNLCLIPTTFLEFNQFP